jgi:hypothetical protein
VSFRALPLLGVGALLVLLARAPGTPAPVDQVLVSTGYLAALASLWLNRHHGWLRLVLLGAALNAAAILANGGRMPVSAAALSRIAHPLLPRHVLAGPGIPLSFLGDVLPAVISGVGVVLSPGDVFMAVGVAGFIQAAMSAT